MLEISVLFRGVNNTEEIDTRTTCSELPKYLTKCVHHGEEECFGQNLQ